MDMVIPPFEHSNISEIETNKLIVLVLTSTAIMLNALEIDLWTGASINKIFSLYLCISRNLKETIPDLLPIMLILIWLIFNIPL